MAEIFLIFARKSTFDSRKYEMMMPLSFLPRPYLTGRRQRFIETDAKTILNDNTYLKTTFYLYDVTGMVNFFCSRTWCNQ